MIEDGNIAIEAARAAALTAGKFSPLNTVIGLGILSFVAMILKHTIASRKTKIAEDESGRAGLVALVTTLQGQVERMDAQLRASNGRIEALEAERGRDHRLIIELMGQLNRTQAAAIRNSNNLSPELARALGSLDTIEGTGHA